jgi:hypothetical protein
MTMKIIRLAGCLGGVLMLSAASCPPQKQDALCLTFEGHTTNEIVKTPVKINGWSLIAVPASGSQGYPDSFRYYDPSNDGGPSQRVGPEVYGEFEFMAPGGGRRYSQMTIDYVNDSTFQPEIRLLDASTNEVASGKFAAEPQNSALTARLSVKEFSSIRIKGGEMIVGRVCVQ